MKDNVTHTNNGHIDNETGEVTEYVPVEKKRLDSLLESERFLEALQDAGVDNWEGYSYAWEIMEGKDPFG